MARAALCDLSMPLRFGDVRGRLTVGAILKTAMADGDERGRVWIC